MFTFLSGNLVIVDSEIIPDVVGGQSKLGNYYNSTFWKEASLKVDKFDFYKSNLRKYFNHQVDSSNKNILNEEILKKKFSTDLRNFFK